MSFLRTRIATEGLGLNIIVISEIIKDFEARSAKDAARANLAEEKLQHFQMANEDRIASLEAQVWNLNRMLLSHQLCGMIRARVFGPQCSRRIYSQVEELSGTVAYYDRMIQQSQGTIQNLREELAKALAQQKVAAIYSAIGENRRAYDIYIRGFW